MRGLWRRGWVKLVAGFVALVVVFVAASGGLLAYRYSQIDRIDLPEGTLDDEQHDAPQNFLLIGSDSRAFVAVDQEAESYGTAEEVGAPKADTILVARTFPDEQRIALVSFPRDLWVPIAGADESGRINTAIEGGTARLVDTLRDNWDIPIHHVVQIDFRGFKGLVNAVGGVDVYFASPVRDWDREQNLSPTGLDIREAGCARLNGDVALAYVRSRHYETFIDGHWVSDPTGDLNRIARQQDFIRRTLRQALSRGLGDPRKIERIAASADDLVQLDHGLGLTDLARFGRNFRSLSADALETYSLPTRPGVTSGGAQVLYLETAAADAVLDVFRGKVPRPVSLLAGSVRMNVVESAGERGRLRAAAFRLAAAGFIIANAGDSSDRSDKTVISYGAGQRAKAELLATWLEGDVVLQQDDGLVGVDVVLLLGRDFAGVKESVAPAPTATTTLPSTEAPTSTSTPVSTPATVGAHQPPAAPTC